MPQSPSGWEIVPKTIRRQFNSDLGHPPEVTQCCRYHQLLVICTLSFAPISHPPKSPSRPSTPASKPADSVLSRPTSLTPIWLSAPFPPSPTPNPPNPPH